MAESKHLLDGERVESVTFPEINDAGNAIDLAHQHKVWDITPEQLRQLRLPTAEEIQAIREAAQQEGQQAGYQAGYAAGEKAGYASGAKQVQQEVQRLSRVFAALAQPLAQQEAQISTLMADILTQALTALVKRELCLDPRSVRAVVDEALNTLNYASGPIRVKLNPSDVALYQAEPDSMTPSELVQIVADASISVGGCVVETTTCEVDARLESRIGQLLETFSNINKDLDLSNHDGGELEV
ncbi:MAG: FliH/SctL family protein [Gammaproteobacteria bacterium]